jgi:hypothetical protein
MVEVARVCRPLTEKQQDMLEHIAAQRPIESEI